MTVCPVSLIFCFQYEVLPVLEEVFSSTFHLFWVITMMLSDMFHHIFVLYNSYGFFFYYALSLLFLEILFKLLSAIPYLFRNAFISLYNLYDICHTGPQVINLYQNNIYMQIWVDMMYMNNKDSKEIFTLFLQLSYLSNSVQRSIFFPC